MADSVVALLRQRKLAGGHAPFADGCRVALVAEGGAMRGVIAGGMVSAIEAEGLAGCFDMMIGTSAGACALAYLRAGQARFGTRMFYENINNRAFISFGRALIGRPIVDTGYLVDEVFARAKALDIAALSRPGPALFATATDVDRAELVELSGFEEPGRAFEILRATARMPLLSGAPVALDGRRLMDGGLVARVPIRMAIARGATHILAILTRSPDSPVIRQSPWADRVFAERMLSRTYGARFRHVLKAEADEYRLLYETVCVGAETELDGVRVNAVSPAPGIVEIGRTTKSAPRLIAAARHAEERMLLALRTGLPAACAQGGIAAQSAVAQTVT